jgi:lysophospholipase L1-like esterase
VGFAGASLLGLVRRGSIPGTHRLRTWLSDQRHAARIEGFAAEAGRVPEGAVVFLGSSTIEGFPFAKLFPGAPCSNRGVGGDTTLGLLRRLDASLPVARPSGIVIYSGANDLRAFHEAPADIVGAMASVLDAIAARFSGVPVALIGTMPVCDPPPGDAERLRALNEGLRALATARGAAFVGTVRPPLADANGRLERSMSVDGEHLVTAGYEVLARWLLEDGGKATERLRASPPP